MNITVPEAAKMAGTTQTTIRSWLVSFKIGKKVGGRWVVYKEELNKVLSGEIHYPTRYEMAKKKREQESASKTKNKRQ